MTLFDLVAILLVVAYLILGWFTGAIRRVIGLVTVYLASVVATYMGQQGGTIIQQYNANITTPDARLYGWLFFLFLIIVVIEAMATAVHTELQLSVVALDKVTGVLLGLVSAGVLVLVLAFMLAGFAQPLGSGAIDDLQIKTRDMLTGSTVGLPLAQEMGPVLILLQGALPGDPKTYFGTGAIRR